MKLNSIHFKFRVLYVVALGLILLLFSGLLYASGRYVLYKNLDEELSDKGKEVAEMINVYLRTETPNSRAVVVASRKVIRLEGVSLKRGTRGQVEERLLKIVDKYDLPSDNVTLLDSSGLTVVRSGGHRSNALELFLRSKQAVLIRASVTKSHFDTLGNHRVMHMPVRLGDGKQYTLQIATSIKTINQWLEKWLIFIACFIPLVIFIASFGSHAFVMQILRPVNQIAHIAEKISHEDLSLRVQTQDADEEIQYLVRAFNEMIERLEQSFKHIQEFSSHVAHELKTPLAVIRGESEIALRKDRDSEEYRRVLEVNLREAERMVKVIDDMLLISRLEYETEAYRFQPMNLQAFLKEIHEQSQMLATKKNIQVHLQMQPAPIQIRGDALHLRRLFFNLIDNAIKFTSVQGQVHLQLTQEKDQVKVEVSDTGLGITDQDLPKIFDKFFHRDRTDFNATPGNGLGLSIALSIAKAHQGNIQVRSQPGKGTTFSIFLPGV